MKFRKENGCPELKFPKLSAQEQEVADRLEAYHAAKRKLQQQRPQVNTMAVPTQPAEEQEDPNVHVQLLDEDYLDLVEEASYEMKSSVHTLA